MILNQLNNQTSDIDSLHSFIQKNSIRLYDFFIVSPYHQIVEYRQDIERYILLKFQILKSLDFTNIKNQSFIICLLNVSERLGLHSQFEQLYRLAKRKQIEITPRIEATSKFLMAIIEANDYVKQIDTVVALLSDSLDDENEINNTRATLLHFYLEVYKNFAEHNQKVVLDFSSNLLEKIVDSNDLCNDKIRRLLSVKFENYESGYSQIINLLDSLLEVKDTGLSNNLSHYLIEKDTSYVKSLVDIEATCDGLYQLTKELYVGIKSDDIFYSLERGTKILTEKNQLLAYIFSYGQMHFAKLSSAFDDIDEYVSEDMEIIDWGCGQGLATINLLEKLRHKNFGSINNITLVEPSETALKRATLNTRKFNNNVLIRTLNKDLDSIEVADFITNDEELKVHLFSNILDIDHFSMSDLIQNIKSTFKNRNLFIVVSPYISFQKTQRIDSFVEEFSNYKNFSIIKEVDEKKGEWSGEWTRVIRVFQVDF